MRMLVCPPAALLITAAVVPVAQAADAIPTFSKDVAPIIYQHCVQCHRPNTTAPMSLIQYKDVRPWARAIREKVVSREMPPWSADAHYGHFQNDPHLSDAQVALIAEWVKDGAPEGDPSLLPPVPPAAQGWHIGTPDKILEMEEDFEVPADKEIDMQYFILDPKFTKDTWVQAAEIMEGNPRVVHHASVFIYDPDDLKPRPRDQQLPGVVEMPKWQFKPPAPYKPTEIEARMGLAEVRTHEPFAAIGHGEPSRGWPEGTAKLVKAGSKIVLQVHYHPSGKVEKDRSKVGLIFCKTPPDNEMFTLSVVNMNFTVPARDPNYEVRSEATFLQDVHIYSLQPHMHLRGKDMTYTLVYPDGREEILLKVPKFDFGLQFWYELEKPIAVPKGSVIKVVAHFDNSANNKLNPNPNVDVKRGLQTTDEMMNGHLNMTVDGWARSRNGRDRPGPPITAAER
jgi:hypothetical protein